jgi:N4-gp56 family major capsid protein
VALTNFAALTDEEKTIWAKQLWKHARNQSFINQFAGKGPNSMVQRITELRKDEKGARAVITLVKDLTGDGVTGDHTLEGNEEAIGADDQVIRIDQLRNANRLKGRLADQKSVVNFRETSRDVLAYWLSDRLDQLAFLTLSGISYARRTNGTLRPVLANGQNLAGLEYAADVKAPTNNRHFRWVTSTKDWAAGNTLSVAAGDCISYESLVMAKAMAKDRYIRGIKISGNEEVFHVFLTPTAMAQLRLDPTFIQNVRHAGVRGSSNELFAGASSVMVDGMVIHEFRHVYNTSGLPSGQKWGGSGTVDGVRALFCGAQALGMADIGNAYWEEKDFDYSNSPGISCGKMFGFLKPQFESIYEPTTPTQDFGVLTLDYALTKA